MFDVSMPSLTNIEIPEDYTKVTFEPDLQRFGVHINITESGKFPTEECEGYEYLSSGKGIVESTIEVFKRRVYDMSATLPGVSFTFNNEKIPISSFSEYVSMFSNKVPRLSKSDLEEYSEKINQISLQDSVEDEIVNNRVIYSKVNPRWEIAVKRSTTGSFEQMSFVNNVWTPKGGSHVALVTNQVSDLLSNLSQFIFIISYHIISYHSTSYDIVSYQIYLISIIFLFYIYVYDVIEYSLKKIEMKKFLLFSSYIKNINV